MNLYGIIDQTFEKGWNILVFQYFNIGFRHGFVVDGIEEPIFKNKPNSIFAKIPAVIIVKMKMR